VRAGWSRDGDDGRLDARVWGGDLPQDGGPFLAHECWVDDARTYLEFQPENPNAANFGAREDCPDLLREAYDAPSPEAIEQPVSEDLFDIAELPAEDAVGEEAPTEEWSSSPARRPGSRPLRASRLAP